MAIEARQDIQAYVHYGETTARQRLRVFFTETLDTRAPLYDAHLEVLRRQLFELQQLEIYSFPHHVTLYWWLPQQTYCRVHLVPHEMREHAQTCVIEVLASLFEWPASPGVVQVNEVAELLGVERESGVSWGLGSGVV